MSRHRTLSVPSWSRKVLNLLARLRRWRRSAWMGRVPWLWPAGQTVPRSKTPLVTPTRLALEFLENRETPNDVMNLIQGGFAWGGLTLIGHLDTPASVVMKGWTAPALLSAPAPAPTTIPDAYAATPWETAQEVPWTPQILGLSPTESSEAVPPSTSRPLVMGPSEQQPQLPVSDDAWTEWGQEPQTSARPRGMGKSSVENNAAGGGGSPHSTPSTGGVPNSSGGGSMAGLGSTVPSLGGNSSSTTSTGPAASPAIFVTNTSGAGTASAASQPILSLGTLLMTPGTGTAGSTTTNLISGNSSSAGNPSGATSAGSTTNASAATQAAVQAEYGQLPLRFEVNEGQVDSSVQFVAQGLNYGVYLTGNGALLGLTRTADSSTTDTSNADANDPLAVPTNTPTTYITDVIGLQLVGANPQAQAVGVDELATKSNYLIGNDPSQWHTNVANYAQVEYQDVYAGVNLIYYGNSQGQLESDFDVAAGADPSAIQFTVQGAQALALDAQDNLVITTASGGTLTQRAPTLYQEVNGVQQTVSGAYVLEGNNQVGFQVGAYNPSLALTIDPVLVYSTYLDNGAATGIAVDSSGNAYITGTTSSSNFPTTPGAYQTKYSGATIGPYSNAFVTKLNAAGTGLVYSTYLGGSGTYGDAASSIAVDSSGDAYITGYTYSANFPVTSGAYQTNFPTLSGTLSAFVTELNASGSGLIYSTFFSGPDGGPSSKSIAVDSSGDAYITGFTGASNFPITASAYQTSIAASAINAFVTKFNASGTGLVYSTYLGGSATDEGYGISVDSSGDAYITGVTSSTNFPVTAGAYQTSYGGDGDAFVTKLNASGSGLDYSTYLGGSLGDEAFAIAVDSSGAAYITGWTASTNFPTTPGAFQSTRDTSNDFSAFVTKLNASGSSLVYSTYLDGSGGSGGDGDRGNGIVVNGSGVAYITDYTIGEPSFPTTADAYQTSAGGTTAYVTALNATGTSLVYSTLLGTQGVAIALDSSGAVYVTGGAGSGFPVTAGAFQTAYSSNGAAFITKLEPWLTAYVRTNDPLQGTSIPVGDATVATQDGNLSTSLPLQLAVSTNSDCGCGDELIYNTDTAAPRPIVEAVFQPDASYGIPTQIQARLTWNGSAGSWVTFGTSVHSAGDAYDLALQLPSTVSTAGFYRWQIEVKATLTNGITTDGNYFGTAFVDILTTPFGNGWTLGSLDHLVIGSGTSAGLVAFVYGTGGYRIFTSEGNGAYQGQANDFGTLSSATAGGVTSYTYALNGTTETFTSTGLLDHTTYPDGKATSYVYSSGNLSKVLKPDGAVSTFLYSGSLISSIQEPGGLVVTLTHNSNTLTNVTMPDGSVASYTYDSSRRMLTNAWGPLSATYAYNSSSGLIATAYLGGGETLTFEAASAQGLVTTTAITLAQAVGIQTDASGNTTTYQYDALGRPTEEWTPNGATQSFQYDGAGDLTGYTDGNGNVTSYTYDAYGDVLTETDPNGSVSSYQYNATYHEVTQAIDPKGNTTSYVYNSAGELTETIDPQGDVTTQVWSSGLLQNVIDPRGDITSYIYNSALEMTSMTTAAGTTTYTYDAAGNMKTVTDPLGLVTSSTYDGMGRLLTQTTPDGGVTTYLYDKAGDLRAETDPLGHVTSYGYDSRGDPTSVTEAYGTAVAQTTTNVYNSLGELLSTEDANGNITSYVYDALGRQTEEIDAYGTSVQSITTTVYDAAGNVLSTTDGNGNITSYAYDSLNRIDEEIDAYGSSIASTTTMIYDAAGNLLSETTGQSTTVAYAHSSTTSFAYDSLNRQTEEIDAYGTSVQRESYTAYDPAGNVLSTTDANGNVTSYAYDSLNEMIEAIDAYGTSIASTTTMLYDADGNLLSETTGQSTTVAYAHASTTSYAYDVLNRPTEEIDAYGTSVQSITTTVYDKAGNVLSTTDGNGNVTSYGYDALNQETEEIDGYSTAVASTTTMLYDAVGNLLSETTGQSSTVAYANPSTTSFAYDALNRTIEEIDAYGTSIASTTTMLYDNVGNLLSETTGQSTTVAYAHPSTTSFAYDALNRQTQEIDAYGTSIASTTTLLYDAAGNLLSETTGQSTTVAYAHPSTTSFAYDALNQQTEQIEGYGSSVASTSSMVYDAAGDLLSTTDGNGNITSYAYDALNRQTQEIDAYGTSIAGTTTLLYDAAGNLLSETTGQSTTVAYAHASTTSYAYDALNQQTEEIDGYGTSVASTTSMVYDAVGNLLSTTDGNGNITSYAYDALNRQTQEIDAYGTAIATTATMLYDAVGNLLSETTGQSTTVAYAHPSTTSYAYDALDEQTEQIEGYGTSVASTSSMVYDAAGNLLSSTDGTGNITSYAYDALNRQTQEIDAYGTASAITATMLYDAAGNLLSETTGQSSTVAYSHASTTSYAFDALNRTIEEIDGYGTAIASTTTMLYDSVGNLLSETTGQSTTVAYAQPSTTSYAYDALNRQTEQIQGYGTGVASTTTMLYDAAGNLLSETTGQSTTVAYAHPSTTSYAYDALNQQTEEIDGYGTSVASTTSMVYDAVGNLLSTTDGNGNITSYAYDALNRQTQEIDAYGTAIATTTTMLYDAAGNLFSETTGQSTTVAYANPSTTSYGYDALNRQTQEIDAYGTAIATTTTMLYDAAGNLLSETTGQSTTVAYAHASTISYAYDALNRQVTEIDAYGVDGVQETTTTVYDAASDVVQSINAFGNATTYTYDALGRTVTNQTPAGGTSTTVYDSAGNVLVQIDTLGYATSYNYDALNREITTTDADGYVTSYSYDAAGNQVTLTDASGNTTTTVFDALNRPSTQINPLGFTSTYVYDNVGNLTSFTDANGNLRTVTYDALNRETGETWTVSGSVTDVQTFTYDAAGNQLTAADYSGTYTMAYDALNRMTSDQEPFEQALTYSYDAASNRILVQDSQGGVTTSVYDALNRLTSLQFGGTGQTTLREDLTYTPLNDIATENRYTDLAGTQLAGTSSYVYDAAGRLTNLTQTDGSSNVLASYVYNYNTEGWLTSETDDDSTTSYSYDHTGQLTQAGAITYGYDATGNRTNTGYQIGTGNQILNDGTWTYTYDNAGELIKKSQGPSADTWTYGYNLRGQLAWAKEMSQDGGGTLETLATFTYDVFGNLLEQDIYTSISGTVTTTRFAYDGSNAWVDLSSTNTLQMRRLYLDGDNQVVARVDNTGTAAWYLTDYLGSVHIVASYAGSTVLDAINYDAYGNITSESNAAEGDSRKYAGYVFEVSVGMYAVLYRWYNPATGTWTSPDPIGFSGGSVNLEEYVGNHPTNATDPRGTDAKEVATTDFSRIPASRIDEMPNGLVQRYKNFVYIADVTPNGGLYVMLLQRRPEAPIYAVCKGVAALGESNFYQVVAAETVPRGSDPETQLANFRQPLEVRLHVEAYLGDKNAKRWQAVAGAVTFGYEMLPFGAAWSHAAQGNWKEMAISLTADAAFFATGPWANALKGARYIRAAGMALEGGVGIARATQGIFALESDKIAAAGYFGEATLRLLGVSAKAISALKSARLVRPKTGDLFERTINTSKGPVDMLAEIVVEGDTIILKDVAIFPRTAEPLTGLTREILAASTQLANDARQLGFKKLRITGRRVASSTSANPGKEIDITVNLTK